MAALGLVFLTGIPAFAVQYDPTTKLLASDGTAWQRFGSSVAISGDTAVVGTTAEAVYVYQYGLGSWAEKAKLTPSSGLAGDRFGESVAISGDTIVVGARTDDDDVYAWATDVGSAYVFRHNGTAWVEEAKLVASDRAKSDGFGTSVAISGDVILIGVPGKSDGMNSNGAAYVYRYDGATWVEEEKLTASDAAPLDYFGRAVALSGDTALIGSPNDQDNGAYSGSAYLFEYDGANWVQDQKIKPAAGVAYDEFGSAMAISGSTLVVGLSQGLVVREGAAYVFRHDGSSWLEEARLTSSNPLATEYYGTAVAISGDTVLVGAFGSRVLTINGAGATYVYWHDGASWIEESRLVLPNATGYEQLGIAVAIDGSTVVTGVAADKENGNGSGSALVFELTPRPQKLVASDGAAADHFGAAVALAGSQAVVGSPDDDDSGARSGSAYFFEYDGQDWLEDVKVLASDAGADGHFGGAVSMEAGVAVVGSPATNALPGAAYVFRHDVSTGWSEEQKLTPSDTTAEDAFGTSAAISGSRIVVGAPATDNDAANGAAYVFTFNGSVWAQQTKLTASDGQANDEFGNAVSIAGDTIVVGAHLEDASGIDAGAAYVYHYNGSAWVEQQKIVGSDVGADDEFGSSVANSGDTIAVGAMRDDDLGSDAGAVYAFTWSGLSWVEKVKLTAADGVTVARFGIAVAMSSAETILVGAEYHEMKGAAYAFWRDGLNYVEEPKLVAPDLSTDYFGASVAISGDQVLIGSPYNDNVGAAYVSTLRYIPEPSMTILNLAALIALTGLARRRSRA